MPTRDDGDRDYEGPDSAGAVATAGRRPGGGATAVRTIGEILITAGLVVLLFVVYELYITDIFSANKQADANTVLDDEWKNDRTLHPDLVEGQAFARMYIPEFGADYHFTIQEGTTEKSLVVGPGHYTGTPLPGEPGNFAVAGHRVGKGAPFNDLDELHSCSAIIIETHTDFYVYKVLPYEDEQKGWETGKGQQPDCRGVSTLRDPNQADGGAYGKTVGRKVVAPNRGDATNPVPYRPKDILPAAGQVSLLTLTTCHPQFSARERLIIHSVLTRQVAKTEVGTIAELTEKLKTAGETR
ncbi:class E sortase [Amycolatopsis sp. NPDC059657]|uniref:class E sortase n=1 Tax=Amycolatopsis sp. NPDC059657 TaxID=3346899 RepID=UPI00366CB4A1